MIAVVCVLMLVVSFFTANAVMSTGPSEDQVAYVRISSPTDIHRINELGGTILYRYHDFALVELSDAGVMGLSAAGLHFDLLDHRTVVHVKGWSFDIREGPRGISSEMALDGYPSGTYGLYIVHMLGPISGEWVNELEGIGVDLINYIPYYAYEVRMTPEQASEVEKLQFVDWVGIYQPAFKLAPDLEPGPVSIRLTRGVDPGTMASISSKVNILHVTELATFGTHIMAEVQDVSILNEMARMPDVYYISNHVPEELLDEIATQIIGGGCWYWDDDDDPSTPYRGYGEYGSLANQLGYTGAGVVTAVADTGIGDGTVGDAGHLDFTGRVLGGYSFDTDPNDWRDQHSHGTHCAGSAGGDTYHGTESTFNGGYYSGQGSAPETEFFAVQIFDGGGNWVGPSDYYEAVEIAAKMSDAYVHTNSWGGSTEGSYGIRDEAYDMAVRDADRDSPGNRPMVITAAAGNNGAYNSINSPANGKNVITVGATRTYTPGTRGGVSDPGVSSTGDNTILNPDIVASFSSQGWTEDRRVKPDLMAPGESIYSTMPGGGYGTKSGTSMSTPAVAGAAAVVVEWYETHHGYRPSPAMVKALMINTANDMTRGTLDYRIPNRGEGWGMVNLPGLMYSPVDFMLEDQTSLLTTGQIHEYFVEVQDTDEPFKVSVVWTDKNALPGDSSGGTPTLKNNIDLEIESPGGDLYRGNAFDENGDGSSDTGFSYPNRDTMVIFDHNDDGWDNVNNVQNVYIHPDLLETGVYTVRVIGTNIPMDANNDGDLNQDYALVMQNSRTEGNAPEVSLTRPAGGESFTAGTLEEIEWNTQSGDDPISHVDLWYSIDAGSSWKYIATELPDTGSHTWTIPNEESSECAVRVRVYDSLGRRGEDISHGSFTITGTPPLPPTNLKVEHYGIPQAVANGIFEGGYAPWTLTRVVDDGESRWDSESYLVGGSVYAMAEASGEGNIAIEESYWQQDITPTSNTMTLSCAFRRNVQVGSGMGWATHVHHASVELLVHDSAVGWQRVFLNEDITSGDSGWIESIPVIYEPTGSVNSVKIQLHIEAEGDTGPMGGDHSAVGELWLDEVNVLVEGAEGTEDNLLIWDASPDDPDEVSHYNIYRSESDTGPWGTPLDSIEANGTGSYQYIDPGTGTADDVIWWYVVRAMGKNGLEDDNHNAVPEPILELELFEITLSSGGEADGWNFVSFNLALQDNSLESILEDPTHGISGNYDRVIYFHASSGEWRSYVPGRPAHFNNLASWNNRMGIWIRMTDDDVLMVQGTPPVTTTIRLEPGWNMVGLPSETSGNHGLPSEVSLVGNFDPSSENNIAYVPSHEFVFMPGMGYWVFNNEEYHVDWIVSY